MFCSSIKTLYSVLFHSALFHYVWFRSVISRSVLFYSVLFYSFLFCCIPPCPVLPCPVVMSCPALSCPASSSLPCSYMFYPALLWRPPTWKYVGHDSLSIHCGPVWSAWSKSTGVGFAAMSILDLKWSKTTQLLQPFDRQIIQFEFLPTWSCVSLMRSTTSSEYKLFRFNKNGGKRFSSLADLRSHFIFNMFKMWYLMCQ